MEEGGGSNNTMLGLGCSLCQGDGRCRGKPAKWSIFGGFGS